MIRRFFAPASALVLAFPQIAAAEETPVLAPSSPWTLRFGDDTCLLAREFGQGDDKVEWLLEKQDANPFYRLTLVGERFRSTQRREAVILTFDFSVPLNTMAVTGTSAEGRPTITFMIGIGYPPSALGKYYPFDEGGLDLAVPADPSAQPPSFQEAHLRAVTTVRVKTSSGQVALQTGSLGKLLTATGVCMDDLLARWGFDVEARRGLKTPPRPIGDPGDWLESSDHATGSADTRQRAAFRFRLSVSPDGRASNCAILSSASPESVQRTCELIRQRARFRPAIGADDKPVAYYFIGTVMVPASPPN